MIGDSTPTNNRLAGLFPIPKSSLSNLSFILGVISTLPLRPDRTLSLPSPLDTFRLPSAREEGDPDVELGADRLFDMDNGEGGARKEVEVDEEEEEVAN